MTIVVYGDTSTSTSTSPEPGSGLRSDRAR
jgi:hypothetical protein